MNNYDIVGKAVQKYWKETYPQDVVAFFYQKYDYQSDDHWELCYERAYGDPLIDKPTWDKFYADVVCEMEKRKNKEDD